MSVEMVKLCKTLHTVSTWVRLCTSVNTNMMLQMSVWLKQLPTVDSHTVFCCCALCNKSFSQSSSLQRHKRHVHSSIRPYDCPYCGKLFKRNTHLKHHVRIHTGAKPYSCRHCSQCFTHHIQLNTHLLKSHNEGTWLTCNICEKKFSSGGQFKQHLVRHEGVKPFVCSQCAKCFCTVRELSCHQLVHSDYKQFCCGLCGKDFKHKRYVVQHFKKCSTKL